MPLRHRIAVGLTLTTLLAPAAAEAQFGRGRINVAEGPGQPKQSVYVRDSAVAAEKLALAQRMERLKEWNKAADVYQEIVEKYADRVVPAGGGPAGPGGGAGAGAGAGGAPGAGGEGPGGQGAGGGEGAEATATRYTSVTLEVQKRLGKWPDDGLEVYRARYETPASSLLEAAGTDDPAGLSRVVQLYFPTDAAKTAGLRLMELYIETGEFAAAAWLGERLLENHPGVIADRPKVLFRTALAQHLAGNAPVARARLDELKQKHADATGAVRGRDVQLADELEKLIASPPPVAHGGTSDSWPMFGGDPSRGRVVPAAGRPGAKIADISLTRGRPRVASPEQKARLDTIEKNRREQGLNLGVMPSVDRGELFYQDNSRVYAASVDSGMPLPGWAITYGRAEPRGGRYAGVSTFLANAGQMTVTVTDSSVLAILGQSERLMVMNDAGIVVQPDRDTQLVCLDRATGARRWAASPRQLPDGQGGQASLRALDLVGSPLVIGDNVYVQGRGGKPMQFEDSYVLCYSLNDGKLRWACYLASGNAPGENFSGAPQVSEAVSHLAYAGGRVYAVTNLGAVAAVDAYAGTIAWLALYPKPHQFANAFIAMQMRGEGGAGGPQQRKPWAQNPAILRDGKVFALPTDARHLLVYDAATGDEIKRIAMEDFDEADTLLGVVGDRLIVAGANRIFCINWPAYQPGKGREPSLWWYSRLAGPQSKDDDETKDAVRGRGFVTADSVFVPTRWNLRRLDMKTGLVAEAYPSGGANWPSGEGPGNVLVTGDHVVLAGSDNIVVYSDLALARAKLDQSIAEAPADPLPRLKYAETLFAAGQIDAAVAKLDEAIHLLGGMNAMRPGAERDRAFARALAFAERSADKTFGATDPARAAALFDRAAAAAGSPQQQVAWRLSRARFARAQTDFDTEVRLFQEILSTAEYRGVSVPTDDGSGTTLASTVAEMSIAGRVKDNPASYRPFEEAATRALDAAKRANDPGAMLAVAQTFPNAKVAPQAMLAAAAAYEAAGSYRPAAQVLNQLYRKYRTGADRARVIEALARNYLRLPGGTGIAIGRLKEGAKFDRGPQLTQPLVLPDGSTVEQVTFGAAVELLQKYSARLAAASLPEFNLPAQSARNRGKPFVPEAPDTVLHDVDLLVLPPRELRQQFARHDRVVTWAASKGLSVYAVGTNVPLATSDAIKQAPRGGVWVGNDLLVWTADRLALLRAQGGATAWEAGIKSLPPVDLVGGEIDMAGASGAGGDDAQAMRQMQPGVIVGPNGGVIIDQRVGARRLRQLQIQGVQAGNLPGGNRRGGGGGAGAAQQPGAAGDNAERIEHVRPVGDRIVIATSTGRIAAFELANGNRAWQTRLADAALDQLVANDDFVAARFGDETGVQIAALETYAGQVVLRQAFSNENGQVPQNMALSPDGTLLYTLPDRLCGKDLYDPRKEMKFGSRPMSEGSAMFAGATRPDQLLVAEGRVLAVADNGQFVRVLSSDDGTEINRPLNTGATNWNVWCQVVGPRLYAFNAKTVLSYSLDRPDENWSGSQDLRTPTIRDAFIGKRHIVLLDQPTPQGVEPPQAAAHFRLLAHGRYPRSNGPGESARLDQNPDIQHPAGIDQWQPVEGGFYYRSIDRRAHFLKGADKPTPATATAPAGGK